MKRIIKNNALLPEYTVVRRKRKTVAITVKSDGEIVICAPLKLSISAIEAVLSRHLQFVNKRLARLDDAQAKFGNLSACLFYLGEPYNMSADCSSPFDSLNNLPQEERETELVKIYKRLTAKIVKPRIVELANIYGFSFCGVKVTKAKTRWGSCGAENNICFSAYLSILPQEAIDYVILHELTHTEHKNHGKGFWAKLKAVCPYYKNAEKTLDELAPILNMLP